MIHNPCPKPILSTPLRQPMDDMEVGLGVAVGLTAEEDDYQLIGKLLWEFGD
jgi:hypothetical protein